MRGFLSRRTVLAGLAAAAAMPSRAGIAQIPTNPDVVIVGAGMAGLSAAATLRQAGYAVVIIEARDRIGGRAVTDSALFGQPYDLGATWLHSADTNPLTPIAEKLGFAFVEDEGELLLYLGGKEASSEDRAALAAVHERISLDLERVASAGKDLAAAEVIGEGDRWAALAGAMIGPIEHGVETKHLSVVDWYTQLGTGIEILLRNGVGALVEAFGRDAPVALGTAAKRVDWRGPRVNVEVDGGAIDARAVLITVSNGVLAGGGLAFVPTLPVQKQEAIAATPMGLVDKIAFKLAPGVLDVAPGASLIAQGAGGAVVDCMVRPMGYDYLVAFVGGDLAWELERQGERAAVEFVRKTLREATGVDVAKDSARAHATRWGADPWARGAVSASRPGSAHRRSTIAEPVGDRVFFAGEACVADWATQLPGAYLSGRTAAEKIMAALKRPG